MKIRQWEMCLGLASGQPQQAIQSKLKELLRLYPRAEVLRLRPGPELFRPFSAHHPHSTRGVARLPLGRVGPGGQRG